MLKTTKDEKSLGTAQPVAEKTAPAVCPSYVLRADQPGHIRVLIAMRELVKDRGERDALEARIREFELYEAERR